jgi:Flp pilus assembly protein TadD
MLGQKGDYDGAIPEYHKALLLNPKLAGTHYGLGTALEGKGDRLNALQEYRAAYELDPQNPTFRQAYEHLLRQGGQ